MFDPENGTKGLIFAHETQPDKTIPLCEIDGWWWIFWLDSNDTGLYLGWGFEAIS